MLFYLFTSTVTGLKDLTNLGNYLVILDAKTGLESAQLWLCLFISLVFLARVSQPQSTTERQSC